MAEQTLEVRRQRGRLSRSSRKTRFSRKTRRTRCSRGTRKTRYTRRTRRTRRTRSSTACNGQAREKAIIPHYTRAYAHTTGVLFFCCHKCHTNSITHYVITVYIDFRNNIPHCHTFTLLLHPKKSSKHHPQNNFSTSNLKQPVTFHKTTRCFL